MPDYSDVLKYLRKREGLSQEQLAKKLGISRSRLNNYEQGIREPDFETAELFCDFFNVDMDTLLARQNVEPHIVSYLNDVGELSDATQVLFQTLKGATEEEILQAVKIIEALKKNV